MKPYVMRISVLLTSLVILNCGRPATTDSSMENVTATYATDPDWSAQARIPQGSNRENIYQLPEDEWRFVVREGQQHALIYPVGPTGLLIPRQLSEEVLGWWWMKKGTGFGSLAELYTWLGLKPYPETDSEIPFPQGTRPDYPMGVAYRQSAQGDEALTFGCAACHAGTLFGKQVLGISNRFPRANDIFVKASSTLKFVEPHFLKLITKAKPTEIDLLMEAKHNFRWIGTRSPAALGLDTSLASVGLSLAKRATDPYAEKTKESAKHSRSSALNEMITDSKPAVWWNLKYKTRFLSDGSVISGNPIYTNFLWNEIGRGADMKELETWLRDNQPTIRALTAAVFATPPPVYTDFLPATSIQLAKAQQGEKLFLDACSRCHGVYKKAWSDPQSETLSLTAQLKTTAVLYHEQTPVMDVGTDPARAQGMAYFADALNGLAISQTIQTVVQPQHGYVPPPLVGIWARWPYFHNNAAPNLCAVLTRSADRPQMYYAGEANDPQTDFDAMCNGYPQAARAPEAWRKKEFAYVVNAQGLSNRGHDEGIFLRDGEEIFSPADKQAIIEFLKTL